MTVCAIELPLQGFRSMQATYLGSHLPLAKRVYSSHQRGNPQLTERQLSESGSRKVYKLWTEKEIRLACEAVSQRGIDV